MSEPEETSIQIPGNKLETINTPYQLMKTIITTIAIAAAGLFASATTSEAAPYYGGNHGRIQVGFSYGGGHSYGYNRNDYGNHYSGGYGHGHSCQPYKVSTCEVNRYRQCRTGYDHCGHPYTYHVTVVTYRDHYSDGSSRTYTKVYS